MAHARSELSTQGLEFTRIPAVDADDLDDAAIEAVFDARRSRRSYYAAMHKGEIACYLSHRRAWETFVETSDAPAAVILEDDFALRGPVATTVDALLGEEAPNWDMVKLWSRKRGVVAEVARLDGRHRLVRHRVLPTLAIGQVVTRVGAEKLLARALPIRRPLDVQFQYWWELGLDVLSVDPPLVVDASADIGGSDLQPSATPSLTRKLRREIGRPIFRLTLLAKSAFHDWRRRRGGPPS